MAMKGDIQILLHDRDIGWYTNNARKGYEKYHTVTVSRTISNKPTYTICASHIGKGGPTPDTNPLCLILLVSRCRSVKHSGIKWSSRANGAGDYEDYVVWDYVLCIMKFGFPWL